MRQAIQAARIAKGRSIRKLWVSGQREVESLRLGNGLLLASGGAADSGALDRAGL